jgi:hypothetical protein
MSGVEVMADRYAKFRRLGMFSEFPVRGGRVAQANKEREQARGLPQQRSQWNHSSVAGSENPCGRGKAGRQSGQPTAPVA